jgi:hypothetical protein
VRLTTYRTCSFPEKREVLRTFWSGHANDSEKINVAAREYGPYALALVAIITFELVVIAALLIARANGWAWVATSSFVLSLWSLWWTTVCRQRINAPAASLGNENLGTLP